MHANMTELLAARNGEIGLATSHIAECRLCRNEMSRLDYISAELKQLQGQEVPNTRWSDIVNAYQTYHKTQHTPVARVQSISRAIYALAASILLVGFAGLLNFQQPSNPRVDHLLIELQAQSSALEYVLSNYSDIDNRLTQVQKFRVEQLQWQLIMLDKKLFDMQSQQNTEQLQALWTTRIKHLNTLHVAYNSQPVYTETHEQRDLL